ncbi:PQQ-dependent sugar dehydrogenase [Rhodobacter sp. Har01]|uniref:PQQ-dependent sugar dehydrogenase n=1 Tax=Rhodobacter sp. Har01 TaxID=2883999 RepID=UPI001D085CA3|nr:PQQ-dependent sugar dehydrogenase [Rhodobacter sp. Har01]MCB6176992.1 PQQ-dependent sugar dehydrogenase [Rhodobacter sp. Har01]
MQLGPLAILALLAPPALAGQVETSAGPMQITPVVTGLDEPWGLAFLPDGSFLVTERAGRLVRVADGVAAEVQGAPAVYAEGQGGLLDVMVPRDFATSREVWLSYAMPLRGGGATAAGKAVLAVDGTRLEHFTPLFAADPRGGGRHFGARLVEAADGTVFLTTGDRGTGPEGMQAQDPATAIGKVVHLRRDGEPATARDGWLPGVWSLGHRNLQGATLDLEGRLLTVEHGAQGGDELNAPEAGRNYGWPVISYGVDYGGGRIGVGSAQEGMEQPLHHWVPSIAPSGLMVYSGALVPEWRGDIFFGSLNSDFLGRLDPDAAGPGGLAEERISAAETGRVRDVVEAPDGSIWFLSVYDGAVYRMAPES